MRLTRVGTVWLVLLALAVPGFASVRGICCGPVSAQDRSDCCLSSEKGSDKMPGMDSSAMAGMADGGRFLAVGVAQCGPVESADSSEYVVLGERSLIQRLVLVQGGLSALAGSQEVEVRTKAFARLSNLDRRPPRLRDFDPLSVALRI